MTKLRPLLAAAVLTFVVAAVPAAAEARTVTEHYGPNPLLSIADCGSALRQSGTGHTLNSGGACFDVDPADSTVVISVADDAVAEVAFEVRAFWPRADAQPLFEGTPTPAEDVLLGEFCSTESPTLELPDEAVSLAIHINNAHQTAIDQLTGNPCDTPAPFATTGTITVEFN